MLDIRIVMDLLAIRNEAFINWEPVDRITEKAPNNVLFTEDVRIAASKDNKD